MKNSTRQRQRQSLKLIIFLGLSVVCVVIGLVIVFNMSHVNETKAIAGSTSSSVTIIQEETYPTAVTINESPAARTTPLQANVQLGRAVKPLPADK